ncbi:MAG TPA: ATP-binding protein [Planctomycetaceae bacterium]|nr:ATP-binding protein [Planctomycetaceae bacterium]
MRSEPRAPFDVSPRTAKIVVAALVVVATAFDLMLPTPIVVAVIYTVALSGCLWTRSIMFLWSTAIISGILAITVYRFGPPLTVPDVENFILINHLTAVAAMMFVAVLVHQGIRMHHCVDFQRQSLEQQNAELEELNQQLGQREEEVVRQNEELQSQTEELERQTEELRVTNEELLAWEKRLEQLLELARSLTADTSRSEVFTKICETLGYLAETHAAAILEKTGDELVVQCHYGFGAEGPQAMVIPFGQSFSSKAMSLGQTGYLEDIRLRPDLVIPQPRQGEPFRAVLSTPLRVRGRTIGAIEAYGPAPRSWTAAEVAMIESLAMQASASIQGAELVEEIQQERRRFEAAFRTVPFGMAVADDGEGRRVRLNAAAAAMFQVPSDENISPATPVGLRLQRQIFQGSQRARPDDLPLQRALRGEEVHAGEFDIHPPKGRPFTLLATAAPILDGRGQVAGAVAAYVDITTQKALQRELELRRREAEEASVRKTRFLAAVSHDIRTPANAINLMAEIIRLLAGDPSRSAEILETAQRLQANTHALIELVGDVLDVARFDTGKVELVESEFSLSELIEQECKQLIPLATEKKLQLVVEPPPHLIWLRTDRIKLGRVIGNLAGNAIKFTAQGHVRISAAIEQAPERRLTIVIEDTGIGISSEHLSWIFDEFAQLHNPARDRAKGTGLGLAICNRLVELMGGSISVESRLGDGSKFTVSLPGSIIAVRTDFTALPPSDPNAWVPVPTQRLNLHILLVEDHSATREGTARLLEAEGAAVTEAVDGRTALRFLEQHSFDAVLLDMMLPDLDGREVLRSLQASRPAGLKGIVVLTGDVTRERISEIKSLGADFLIEKPIDFPKLVQILRTFARLP